MNDERLRQTLLAGDPAAGDGGLTPDEIHAMRRAVLMAAPEPRHRLLPWLALAGTAAGAILLAIVLVRPAPAPAPPRVAATAAPPAQLPAQVPVEPISRPGQEQERPPVRHHRPRLRHRSVAPAPREAADTLASLELPANPGPDSGTRQVQFSAPGGTRIIWILKSGTASR
jgi:hypothetical protein